MVFVTELYAGLVWAIIVQIALAIMILSIETVQIYHDPLDYIQNPYNYLELSGSVLVLLTKLEAFKSLNWVMILLILLKGILSFKIFEA